MEFPRYQPAHGELVGRFARVTQRIVPPLSKENIQRYGSAFGEKPHVSTWFITLNSNLRMGVEPDPQKFRWVCNILEQVLVCMFLDPNNLAKFLVFHPRAASGQRHLTPDLLRNIVLFPDIVGKPNSNRKLSVGCEQGPTFRQIHVHAIFRIIHYTLLQLDGHAMQETARTCLEELTSRHPNPANPSGLYLRAKYIPNLMMIEHYLSKQQGTEQKKELTRIAQKDELGQEDIAYLKSVAAPYPRPKGSVTILSRPH